MPRGSIRQRSKVRKDSWAVQVYMGVDPETGKKRYHSETVKGAKYQAQRRLTELLRQMDTGTFVEPSNLTVGEYLRQWLRDYAETHVRQRTWEGYRGSIERYIIPALGNIALDKLLARPIQEMEVSLLRNGGVKGRGLSPRTVLQVHRILFKALRNAVRLDTLQRNVAEAVEPPRITRYEPRVLGWNEVHNLLSQIPDRLYHTLVLLAIQTGLRRSELLGLQWRDVDFDTGTLSVQRALIKLPSGEMVLTQPKTGRGRVVVLPVESVLALRSHEELQQVGPQENGNFIFCHSSGSPLHPDLVTQTVKRLVTKVGVDGLRLHDLRHTHASLMLSQGVHLKIVSERLGHSEHRDHGRPVLPCSAHGTARSRGTFWSGVECWNGKSMTLTMKNPRIHS